MYRNTDNKQKENKEEELGKDDVLCIDHSSGAALLDSRKELFTSLLPPFSIYIRHLSPID